MDNVFDPNVPSEGSYRPSADVTRHVRALRLRPNELIRVLNGHGGLHTCSMEADGILAIQKVVCVPEPPTTIVAMGHLDHRDRMEYALEKVAELGCTDFVPLVCDHSVHTRVSEDRMRTKAQAALTQCGRAWLMNIHASVRLDEFLMSTDSTTRIIVGDVDGVVPDGASLRNAMAIVIVVGPEGGLSQREMNLLMERSPLRWAITKARLRAETAAVAITSVVAAHRDETSE